MTIQDERARPWFQPPAPTGPGQDRDRSPSRPVTTRIAGQLPLDDVDAAPAAAAVPHAMPGPDRVEVTQPYIPAIRDEQPEFVKRLNPDPTADPAPATTRLDPAPHSPAAPTAPTAPQAPAAPAAPATRAQPAQPRKRSLMRRVVRGIIGPDLLRKDPPKRR